MLRRQAIRGIQWTSVATAGSNLLQMLQLIVVSRYVTATDYGLMSLTLVFVFLAQVVGDLGLSGSIVYRKDISNEGYSDIFWLSVLLCLLAAAGLFFGAPLLAALFHDVALIKVVQIAASLFLFLPLQMQYSALLRKNLRFKSLAVADIVSKIIAFPVAVTTAMAGLGVYALLLSSIAGSVLFSLLVFYSGRKYSQIKFSISFKRLKPHLGQALFQAGNELLNYVNYQLDAIVLASVAGVESAGIYSFAKNLAARPSQLINPVFTQVAFPLLSAVNHSMKATRIVFKGFLGHIAMLNCLVYPFIGVFADNIVEVLFGSRWTAAVPVLQMLAGFFLLRSVFNPVGALLTARGMANKLYYWNLGLLFMLPAAVYAAAKYGPAQVAATLGVLFLLLLIPVWRYLIFPACRLNLRGFLGCITRPLLTSFSLLTVLIVSKNLLSLQGLWALVAGFVTWIVAGAALTYLIGRPYFKEMLAFIRTKQ